jgi:hypothetical protein
MAVNYGTDTHDVRRKCGVIEKARLTGNKLSICGFLFEKDMPDTIQILERASRLGMSYEAHDVCIEDMRSKVWVATSLTFTGAAILSEDKAAYGNTTFTLHARATKEPTMADAAAKPQRKRRPKQTGLFAETVPVRLDIPKPILEKLQTRADDEVLPLEIFLVRALAGTAKTINVEG